MKSARRRKGATLGLVAACVLVIIALGVAVFFLAKMFGGGREVANATDAGTLKLAKNALIQPAVILPTPAAGPGVTQYSEFYGCAYPNPYVANPGSPGAATIDLFTYNRCVGQALLIAMNAKDMSDAGSSTAMDHANLVLLDLNKIGLSLNKGLQGLNQPAGGLTFDSQTAPSSAASLSNKFSNGANSNNVGLYGNTSVTGSAYKTAFMKAGSPTNVYFASPFTPATLANLKANSTNSPDPMTPAQYPNLSGKFYMQGYAPLVVSSGGKTLTFYGVPVLPQQKPHLVSTDDFNQAQTDTFGGNTPPNSFRVDASSQEQGGGTSNFGGAVACAIVGAVFQSTAATPISPDFPVAIPTGYIELMNPSGNNLPANFLPVDNSANIFNNELYDGGTGGLTGIYGSGPLETTSGAGGGVFGDQSEIQAWINYNTSTPSSPVSGNNPGGHNPAKYPPTLGYQTPASGLSAGNETKIYGPTGVPANLTQCLAISGSMLDCTAQAATPSGLFGNCLQDLNNNGFENAYGHGTPAAVPAASGAGGVSAVDTVKGAIIANFNGAGYHKKIQVDISGGSNPKLQIQSMDGNGNWSPANSGQNGDGMPASTGLGEYLGPNGMSDVYATPSPANADRNQFPIQNTGTTTIPSGTKASILGLLAQLDAQNGTMASGNSEVGRAPNNNYAFSGSCGGLFQTILARVQQIQPACTSANLEALLNGPVECPTSVNPTGHQASLAMGQTAYIFLNNANLADTTGVTGHGLRIYADVSTNIPSPVTVYTQTTPDGIAAPVAATNSASSCYQSYGIYNAGSGMIDVKQGGSGAEYNVKGDDALHAQPYEQISPLNAEYTATDSAKWVAGSGYGNVLGRLRFADVVAGNATFSSPN